MVLLRALPGSLPELNLPDVCRHPINGKKVKNPRSVRGNSHRRTRGPDGRRRYLLHGSVWDALHRCGEKPRGPGKPASPRVNCPGRSAIDPLPILYGKPVSLPSLLHGLENRGDQGKQTQQGE